MGFLDFLDRVRSKSEAERRRITLYLTVVIWGVIMLVWWSAFSAPKDRKLISVREMLSPWSTVVRTAKQMGAEITGTASDVLRSANELASSSPAISSSTSELDGGGGTVVVDPNAPMNIEQ